MAAAQSLLGAQKRPGVIGAAAAGLLDSLTFSFCFLQCVGVDLPRLLTQEVHDLPLAIKAHHAASHLFGVLHRG
jgi:DeoR/GlpR family transcriptional regulator of sugar metabolism